MSDASDEVKIVRLDDGQYVVADLGGWVPGTYATHADALAAALAANHRRSSAWVDRILLIGRYVLLALSVVLAWLSVDRSDATGMALACWLLLGRSVLKEDRP